MASEKENYIATNLARESNLDFLHDLYSSGVKLAPDQYDLLVRHKRIDPKPEGAEKREKLPKDYSENVNFKSDIQRRADKYVDIVDDVEDMPFAQEGKRHIVLDHETYDQLAKSSLFKYVGGKTITKDDWKPKDLLDHSREFVQWVNSINRGFQSMILYKPFQMYCQQSEDWLNDDTDYYAFSEQSDRKEYAFSEFERIRENTLYFMDKYLQLREGDMLSGNMKYISKPVHKVLCFLIDCGYSLIIGKPRQIAATSTLGGIALCKSISKRNFFIKMIAQDKDKIVEIFDDKIKHPLGELPNWMKPEVGNDREGLLRFNKKTEKKGTKTGVNSKIQVVAPSVAAINGGSPPLVLIDEAGYIGILGKMIKEARPTMFMHNEKTGRLEMKRQIVVWGTGGETDKGGKSFETEFRGMKKLWDEGKYSSGMIPLFFDWTTRPGISKEHYLKEKAVYTVEGPEKESKAVQFRQHYPSIIDDMFLTSYKLLVGLDWINANLERIQSQEHRIRPTRGYFEPVYDMSQPENENSDTPFKIIGANFVAVDDNDDFRATVSILQHPKKNWKNRYYQGTDPVMTDNGYSNMGSVIYDAEFNTPVAILNYRDPDHKYTFLQCLLMGIYYAPHGEDCVKELVEGNVGMAYFDYKESKGYWNSLVQRTELPDHLSGGSALYGIDNRSFRSKHIINRMYEAITAANPIYFEEIFTQLRTFCCTFTENGHETWGVSDTRRFFDDLLFGYVFSYICAESYRHKKPYNTIQDEMRNITKFELRRDAGGNLCRVEVNVNARA